MGKFLILIAFMGSFSLQIFLQGVLLPSRALAVEADDNADDPKIGDTTACLTEDGKETEETWALFEKTIPACKRAIVIFDRGAKLDLGATHVLKNFSTGLTSLKAKVISGKGSYTVKPKTESLDGVNLWISLDRCQMRNMFFTNEKGMEVSFAKARYMETTEELSAFAHGDELKNFKNSCSK